MNIFRVCNIINGALLILAGVYGYINVTKGIYVVYLASYVGFFGALIIAFELRWSKTENRMRRLFGFMFSPYGRACFFGFAATLCWGIDLWLPILIGVLTIISALLQCFIFCTHPGFKEYSQVKKTDNPANLPEDEVIAYLRQNPQIAQSAIGPGATAFGEAPAATRAAPPPRRSKPRAPPAAPSRASNTPPAASSAPSDNPFDL